MNPTVEETFFGAFLDKNPDSTDVHITPEMMNVHITPEMMTDRNDIVIGHSASTPSDDRRPADANFSRDALLPAYSTTDVRLGFIQEKLDLVLQILTTPKRRGRPVGTTGIKKRSSKKRKPAKNTSVKKKLKK